MSKKGNFTQAPNAIWRLYTRLPDFKSDHALMYVVLMDYYNDEYGYAFPTRWTLAERLNCGENKPGELAKVLKKYELIDYDRKGKRTNNVYYLLAPISDEEKFYAKWPQAKEHYEKKKAMFDERRKQGEENRKEYNAKKEIEKGNTLDEDDMISLL